MKHLKPFNESEDWKKYEIEGKMRKSLKSKLPLLGLKVRRKGRKKFEEGTIVIDSFDGKELEYFIMFKEDDMEQLLGLPFQYWNESLNKWEDENFSGKEICFELTDEEKEFLNIYSNLPFKSL
jgi:hypothetical protein